MKKSSTIACLCLAGLASASPCGSAAANPPSPEPQFHPRTMFQNFPGLKITNGTSIIPGNTTFPFPGIPGNRPEPRPFPGIPGNRSDTLPFPGVSRGNSSVPPFPTIGGNNSNPLPRPFPGIIGNRSEPRTFPNIGRGKSSVPPFPTIRGNNTEGLPRPGIIVNRSEPHAFPAIGGGNSSVPPPFIIPGNRPEPPPSSGVGRGNSSVPPPFIIPGNRPEPPPSSGVGRGNSSVPPPFIIPGNRPEPPPSSGVGRGNNSGPRIPFPLPQRDVSLTWDLPGKNTGHKNSLRTRTYAGEPKFVAWVSEFSTTFTELTNINNQSGQTIRPGNGIVPGFGNHTFEDGSPIVDNNGTIFLLITDANPTITPANISALHDHIVAGPALYELS